MVPYAAKVLQKTGLPAWGVDLEEFQWSNSYWPIPNMTKNSTQQRWSIYGTATHESPHPNPKNHQFHSISPSRFCPESDRHEELWHGAVKLSLFQRWAPLLAAKVSKQWGLREGDHRPWMTMDIWVSNLGTSNVWQCLIQRGRKFWYILIRTPICSETWWCGSEERMQWVTFSLDTNNDDQVKETSTSRDNKQHWDTIYSSDWTSWIGRVSLDMCGHQ